MPIIVDKRINPTALRNLERFDTVIPFMTTGVTYPAISGHPDIFFCPVDHLLIASGVVPEPILRRLADEGVHLELSPDKPGDHYPASAIFNAVITPHYLVHQTELTSELIKQSAGNRRQIFVKQGYTRCNLFVPDERLWITSDRGIAKVLEKEEFNTLFVDPSVVLLAGFPHGFFGGCCGMTGNTVLVNGALKQLSGWKRIIQALEHFQISVVELHPGRLEDVGSIISIPSLQSLPAHSSAV
jgi:hypothetical protein